MLKGISVMLILSLVLMSQSVLAAPSEKNTAQEISSNTIASQQRALQQSIQAYIHSQPKVYTGASKLLDYGYKDILFDKLKEFKKQHPEATETEINDYFIGLMREYNRNNPERALETGRATINSIGSWFYEYVEGQVELNSLEQELFDANPSKGFAALVAGDEAADWTQYKFGYNGHNDKTDAFRHAAWNIWIIGFTSDSFWAEVWTSAHELGAINQPQIEYEMDMHNNSIGRLYAFINDISEESLVSETRNTIHDAYVSGSLWHIVNNSVQYFTGSSNDYVN
mgnify:FL=1|jgi:hypothetical protein